MNTQRGHRWEMESCIPSKASGNFCFPRKLAPQQGTTFLIKTSIFKYKALKLPIDILLGNISSMFSYTCICFIRISAQLLKLYPLVLYLLTEEIQALESDCVVCIPALLLQRFVAVWPWTSYPAYKMDILSLHRGALLIKSQQKLVERRYRVSLLLTNLPLSQGMRPFSKQRHQWLNHWSLM